jgi:(p)ppGpp synthase/HD superfamily hydrolase
MGFMVEQVLHLRLRVLAEADSGALMRTLERFQNLGVAPRRVIAEFTTADTMSIQVDIAGLDEAHLSLIANKLGQVPCVLRAYWHYA